jgi:hypothetical protein
VPMAPATWQRKTESHGSSRRWFLARAVSLATCSSVADGVLGMKTSKVESAWARSASCDDGVSASSSLLATIGDDPVAPSLRAATALNLGANPIAVPGGWFVPILGPGSGYAVLDEAGGAPLASTLASLGGLGALGPPISRPFLTADGWTAQVMVRCVIACERPNGARSGAPPSSVIAATPDLLHQAGLDDLLGAAGVPIGASPPRTPTDAWHRLGWLTDRTIRTAYLAPIGAFPGGTGRDRGMDGTGVGVPKTECPSTLADDDAGASRVASVDPDGSSDATPSAARRTHAEESNEAPPEGRYPASLGGTSGGTARFSGASVLPDLATFAGPPTSFAVTTGAWRRQRFERAIIEVAVSGVDADEPNAKPTIVPIGLLLRRATSLPDVVITPDSLVGGTVVVRGPMATVGWRVASMATAATEAVSLPKATATPQQLLDTGIRGPGATPTATGAPVSSVNPSPSPLPPTRPPGARVPGAAIRVRSVVATGGAEQVVLANNGSVAQDIGGWAVRSSTSATAFRLPTGLRLDPGASVTLLSGRDVPAVAPAGSVTLARRSLWRDDGGTIFLVDSNGDEVDRHGWP